MVTTDPQTGAALGRWRNALLGMFAFGGFGLSSWASRLPTLREQLGLDNAGLGLVLAAVTAGSLLGLPGGPLLLARLGAPRAMGVTLGSAATGIGLIAWAAALGSVPLALVGLAVAGFGIGATDVLINIDGAALEQVRGRTLMPLLHAAWPAGAVVGAGMGAGAATLGVRPEFQLGVQAVIMVAAAFLLVRWIPVGHRGTGRERPDRSLTRSRRPILDARLLAIGVVMLAAELGEGAANNWLSVASRDALGFSETFAAMVFAIYNGAQVVVRLAAGPLVDRYGRVLMLRITLALGAVGVALFVLDLGTPAALLGAALWSVGVALGFPLGMSAAAEGEDPASRVAVAASLGYVAGFVGPPMIGLLAQQFGVLTALWPVAVLFAAGVLLAPRFRPLAPAP